MLRLKVIELQAQNSEYSFCWSFRDVHNKTAIGELLRKR